MKKIWQDMQHIIQQKVYIICVTITAVMSYGFAVCQPIIGVDDSAIGRYFGEGLGPIMGRFGYFLLNKICPVAEFTPFITDFIGVLFLMLGTVLWCLVWEKAMGQRLSVMAATAFSCVMISCPMISEVFIYYLHNGVCMCYCLSALLLLYFMEAFEAKGSLRWKKLGIALTILWLTNSFVEAFTIVFLMAIVMVWVLQSICNVRKITPGVVLGEGFVAGGLLAVSIVLRTISIEGITFLFSLQNQIGIMNRRSVLEALAWFQSSQGMAEFVMTIKKYIAMYYVNAIAYIPVRIYVMAVLVLGVWALYHLIRYRRVVPALGVAAMQIIPLILVFLEGHATFYRNSQYVPLYVAFVVLICSLALEKWAENRAWGRKVICAWCIVVGILVYNQAYEMTQWFYVDYMKYEDAKNTVNQIAYELEKNYDTEKPVVFTGNYTIPEHIVSKMYVPYDSRTYQTIAGILDIMDPNLKTCFAMPNGYSLSSEAVYSVLTWGNIAFEVWDKETHEFFAIHGHEFNRISEPETCRDIQTRYRELPAWPKEGSIIETDEYIIVNFG